MDSGSATINYKGFSYTLPYVMRVGLATPIVYLHGLGCSKEDFLGAFAATELASHTILTFTMPGSEGTPYPQDQALDIGDLAHITEALLTSLDLPACLLVGHSLGGVVGFEYCRLFPDRVKGFLNVEGSLGADNASWSQQVQKAGFFVFEKELYPKMKEELKKNQNKGFQVYAKTIERMSAKAYFDYSVSHVNYCSGRLLEDYAALPMPKLFVYGVDHELWRPYLPQLRELGCAVKPIDHSHHFPQYDRPADFFACLAAFAKSLDGTLTK